jgi:hypothetical protein
MQTNNQNTVASASPKKILFCYAISDFRILVEIGLEVEVLEKNTIYPIPHVPKWYLGSCSLRGDVLPVINLHSLLGLEISNKKNRLLKLSHPDFSPIVIAIDKLPYQIDLNLLSDASINHHLNYPDWVISSMLYKQLNFIFADHSDLFSALQKGEHEHLLMPKQLGESS